MFDCKPRRDGVPPTCLILVPNSHSGTGVMTLNPLAKAGPTSPADLEPGEAMIATISETDERADRDVAGDDTHIVSDLQYWQDRLGLKVSRSLCGELLLAEPGYVESRTAPTCPRCAELAGRTERAA